MCVFCKLINLFILLRTSTNTSALEYIITIDVFVSQNVPKRARKILPNSFFTNHNFQDTLLCLIRNDSILILIMRKDLKHEPTYVKTPTSESVSSMKKIFLITLRNLQAMQQQITTFGYLWL